MPLTTLLGILTIGMSAHEEPAQVTIETKIYQVVGKGVILKSTDKLSMEPGAKPGEKIVRVVGVDEQILAKSKGLKLLTSPVVRTLDGTKAEVSVEANSADKGEETSKVAFLPSVQKGLVSLEMTASLDLKANPKDSWSYFQAPKLKSGQPYALMISNATHKYLYVVKAHFGD